MSNVKYILLDRRKKGDEIFEEFTIVRADGTKSVEITKTVSKLTDKQKRELNIK